MTTRDAIPGFPLQWPPGRPRTTHARQSASNFKTTTAKARDYLIAEVARLGGKGLVISTNVPTKKDGMPYAGGYRLDDEGVAAYFTYQGKQVCFACDRWWRLHENMHAVAKTIEALRGIARWGTGDMLDAAVSGFAALPPPGEPKARHWRDVLGIPDTNTTPTRRDLIDAYRRKRSEAHPDKGGTPEEFDEIEKAFDAALEELR